MPAPRRGRYNFDPSKETVLGTLSSNELVIDRKDSHHHLDRDSLSEALLMIDAEDREHLVAEVDLGHIIGAEQCVPTGISDEIVFAHRKNREGPTRFVLHREAPQTTYATVILIRDGIKPGLMILVSAWAGHIGQREPWDRSLLQDPVALEDSINFWQTHALVWDPSEVDFSRPFGVAEVIGE